MRSCQSTIIIHDEIHVDRVTLDSQKHSAVDSVPHSRQSGRILQGSIFRQIFSPFSVSS